MTDPVTDPIEDYLDRLLVELSGRARNVRRILSEVDDHLHDAADEGLAEGLSADDARDRALARFGAPATVARRFTRRPGRLPPLPVLSQLVLAFALLAGVGLVGIGVSGALAGGMGVAFGKEFVAGDVAGVTYTPARCADYLEYHPEASTCDRAAAAHHFDETVTYRLAAGVLGVLVLGGLFVIRRSRVLRRHIPLGDGVGLLPDGFVATVGAAVFGCAAGALLVSGLARAGGGDGVGADLSGGIVAAVIAAVFAAGVYRALSRRVLFLGDEETLAPSTAS
ncbi:MAG: permease prefix domain 1-containing protein [Actinomycetota bacterium]|nr:permease prefix domain 1-containing protein [Actinomycetota bacterium]